MALNVVNKLLLISVRLGFLFVFYLLMELGYLSFSLWEQVTYLWESELKFEDMILHPHVLRYLLVYPFFTISEYMGIDYDSMFMVVVPILVLVLLELIVKSAAYFTGLKVTVVEYVFLSILLILMSSFMNGRMLFSLVGFALILYGMLYWKNNQYYLRVKTACVLLFLSGLFLMSVSSGTFMVGLVAVSMFLLMNVFRSNSWITKVGFSITLLMAFVLIYPMVEVLVMKNIDYYGGVIPMLNHGVGRIFLIIEMELLVLLVLSVIVFLLIQFFLIKFYKHFKVLVYLLSVPLVIGLFGNSTLSMALIPLLVLFTIFITSLLLASSRTSKLVVIKCI